MKEVYKVIQHAIKSNMKSIEYEEYFETYAEALEFIELRCSHVNLYPFHGFEIKKMYTAVEVEYSKLGD